DGYEYRIMGCCVYNMYNVIKGSFAAFENPKGAYSWDIIAGLNLAAEHDLVVVVEGKKYNGEFLDPAKKYRFKIKQKND
nr:inositol monophosphatase [Candidatus Paceibacterota bacterium]